MIENKTFEPALRSDMTQPEEVEEKYRQLLEDMNDGYAVIQDGVYVFANSRLAELFGLDLEQILGKPIAEFMKSEERQEMMDSYDRVMAGVRAYDKRYEGEVIRRDGEKIALESSIKPIQYEGRPAFSVINRDITERRRAEEKYKQLLEDMSDGYVVVQEGKYVFANKRFTEMMGYEHEQLEGMALFNAAKSDNQEELEELYKRMQRGEQTSAILHDVDVKLQDGTDIIVEVAIKAILYEDKPALCAVIRDVTKRKQAEEALRESREQYRLLADNVFDVIWTMDMEFNLTYTSPSMFKLRGYNPEEGLKQSLPEILVPSSLEVAMQALGEGIKWIKSGDGDLNKMKNVELEMYCKDGSIVWTETTADVLFDQDGVAIGFIGVSRDISGRKRVEEKYRQLLDDMSDGYVVIQDGKYVYANRRFTEMMGYSQEQLAGLSSFMFMHADKQQELTEIYEKLQRGEQAYAELQQVEATRADGTKILVEANVKTIIYEGKPALYAIVRDMTERKQIEEELRQHKEHLEELVSERTAELERQSEIVRRQAEEIMEISTPVMQVSKGVMLAPLIGVLDSQRTQQFMERLLDCIAETGSPIALIDITGVPTIDTQTAQHLIETISAVRMLGSDVILTGVRPAIAQALVHLGVNISGLTTRSSLAAGLNVALERLNKQQINHQNAGLMEVI